MFNSLGRWRRNLPPDSRTVLERTIICCRLVSVSDPTSMQIYRGNKREQLKGVRCMHKTVEESAACRTFLEGHVKEDKTSDVQCMLLWTEWIRFSMKARGEHKFPNHIRIKEFNELVHEIYSPALAYDDFRGPLYVGIRFVK